MSDLEIKVAYNNARGAMDEEELKRTRRAIDHLRAGVGTLYESRALLGMAFFLLEYINRLEAKWEAKTAEAVEVSEKRLAECRRKLNKKAKP